MKLESCVHLSRVKKRDGKGRHFIKMLNVQSNFNMSEVNSVRQRSLRTQLEALPSMELVLEAAMKLKAGKTGGNSDILPEMAKACCYSYMYDFPDFLLDLIHTAWHEEREPRDWADAGLVLIPIKGDLSHCGNC